MNAIDLKFHPITPETAPTVAVLKINRPDVANAFDQDVMQGLLHSFKTIDADKHCRAVVLTGEGKHFSAGADLNWMKDSAKLSYQQNIDDASKLTELFHAVEHCRLPVIAAVKGAVFGGAVGLVACSDIVVASERAKFSLSEVKLGIVPAVILPHVARRFNPGQLRRHSLTGRIFSGTEAKNFGLVDVITEDHNFDQAVKDEVNLLLQASTDAQAIVKKLHKTIVDNSLRQSDGTLEAIATARTSPSGQQGLSSFFEKKPAPWVLELDKGWSLND